jgi:hypothetical protein
VAEAIAPHVGRVIIANPRQVRLIAEARIKDRRDRRHRSGSALRERVPARGLGAGCTHPGAAAASHATGSDRSTTRSAESHHSVDPARASRAAVPACRSARAERPQRVAGSNASARRGRTQWSGTCASTMRRIPRRRSSTSFRALPRASAGQERRSDDLIGGGKRPLQGADREPLLLA